MTRQEIQVKEVKNQQDLNTFVRLPWEIYEGDRYWIPPLIKEQLLKFSPKHPFRSHSEMILFLARRGESLQEELQASSTTTMLSFIKRKWGSSDSSNPFQMQRLQRLSFQRSPAG